MSSLALSRAYGEEDWNEFLDALKARGYDDVAVVYLNSLKEKGDAPPELNEEIDLKIGEAALDACAKASGAERERLSEQARGAFAKYLEAAPEGPRAAEANAGLGKLNADRADAILASAENGKLDDEAREAKRLEARTVYSEAKTQLAAALDLFKSRAKSLQEDPSSDPTALRVAQGSILDLSLRAGTVDAQLARTFPLDSDDRKNGLTSAAERFDKFFTTYQQFAASFRARYEEAAIRWELGDAKSALDLLSELAVLPSDDQFVGLKTRSLNLYARIADATGAEDPSVVMTLVKKFNEWKSDDAVPRSHYDSVEGREISLYASRALIALEKMRRDDPDKFNKAGLKTFTDREDPTFKMLNSAFTKKKKSGTNQVVVLAMKTLTELSSGRGAIALQAQDALKDEIFEGIDASKMSFAAKLDDFPSARDAAERDASAYNVASDALRDAADDARESAKKELDDALGVALRSFDAAFEQGARAVRPDKKGKVNEEKRQEVLSDLDRLYLKRAIVCLSSERYEEAFALGEYLARFRSDYENASQGALVALRALQALARDARERGDDERAIASLEARLAEYTTFIGERWSDADPSSAIAQDAALVKLEDAIANGDVESARALVAQIPESSARRALAELRLGRALWNEWNKRTNEAEENAENAEDAPDASKLDELLDGARQAFYDGLERKISSSSGVQEDDYQAIYSTLLLAQVFERQNNAAEAKNWLTHPVIGALSAVERAKDAPDASSPIDDNFQMATLSLALSLAATSSDGAEEAEGYIARLEEIVARSPENAKKLTSVYLQLGKRFESTLRELSKDESKKEELAATTKSFESFLRRALSREEGNGYGSLRWIADSYLALGNGLSEPFKPKSQEALGYYAQAGKTYRAILKKIDEDASFAPAPSTRLAISLKIVECLRRAGAFNKALGQLKKIASEQSDNLDVQLEGARLFQDWGVKDPQNYLKAIVGAEPSADGKNLVWGWNGIIKRLAGSIDKNERFKELYYESLLSKTSCRYRYAQSLNGAEREKQARDAEKEIERIYQTRPDLGGSTNFKKFDAAYKRFQTLRGEKSPVALNAKKAKDKKPDEQEKKTDAKKSAKGASESAK